MSAFRPSPQLEAALYISAAMSCFAAMTLLVRVATEALPVIEAVFFRNLFGLLAILPWLIRAGPAGLRTQRPGLHLLRGAMSFAAMSLWFASVALLPIAEATAISFVAPAFTAAMAVIVLGETWSGRRAIAIAAGFLGAMIILRPGVAAISPWAALPIGAAFLWASVNMVVKILGRSDGSGVIVASMALTTTLLSLPPALWVWVWPEGWMWLALIALGGSASAAHYCLTQALKKGDAGFVAPFDYLRLPLVALLAWIFYGETSDVWTWLGAAVIAAGALSLARAEGAHRSSEAENRKRT